MRRVSDIEREVFLTHISGWPEGESECDYWRRHAQARAIKCTMLKAEVAQRDELIAELEGSDD